jgi:adenosylcobinamide hydrolase
MMGKAVFQNLEVHAFATAGVQSNATRAGDTAKYYEEEGAWKPCPVPEGTINIILHINQPLTNSAMSRAVITLTEAKTAVLMDLGVGSMSSQALATGTGTDQFIICAAHQNEKTPLTGSGPHSKLGECIGKAVYNAVREALEWQNGLDAKRCRGLYYQLKRFGLKSENWLEWLAPHLKESEDKFFEANRLAIEHDLVVSNCVATLCQLLDRMRCGHITEDSVVEHAQSSCAMMVSQLANDDAIYQNVKQELSTESEVFSILSKSLVLGWRAKWS